MGRSSRDRLPVPAQVQLDLLHLAAHGWRGDGHIDPAATLPLLLDDPDAVRESGDIGVDLLRDGFTVRSRAGVVRRERGRGGRRDVPGLRTRRPVIDGASCGILLWRDSGGVSDNPARRCLLGDGGRCRQRYSCGEGEGKGKKRSREAVARPVRTGGACGLFRNVGGMPTSDGHAVTDVTGVRVTSVTKSSPCRIVSPHP